MKFIADATNNVFSEKTAASHTNQDLPAWLVRLPSIVLTITALLLCAPLIATSYSSNESTRWYEVLMHFYMLMPYLLTPGLALAFGVSVAVMWKEPPAQTWASSTMATVVLSLVLLIALALSLIP